MRIVKFEEYTGTSQVARGTFSVETDYRYVFHDFRLFEDSHTRRRWIAPPSKPDHSIPGRKPNWLPLITFVNKSAQSEFEAQVLEALNQYIEGVGGSMAEMEDDSPWR